MGMFLLKPCDDGEVSPNPTLATYLCLLISLRLSICSSSQEAVVDAMFSLTEVFYVSL